MASKSSLTGGTPRLAGTSGVREKNQSVEPGEREDLGRYVVILGGAFDERIEMIETPGVVESRERIALLIADFLKACEKDKIEKDGPPTTKCKTTAKATEVEKDGPPITQRMPGREKR